MGYTAGSSWCAEASDPSPYLQFDLQTLHVICAVSTQGNSQEDEWVETYTLQSSTDDSHWIDYYDEAGKVKVKCKLVYMWLIIVDLKSSIWVQQIVLTLSYFKVDRVFLTTSFTLENKSTYRSVLDVPTSYSTIPRASVSHMEVISQPLWPCGTIDFGGHVSSLRLFVAWSGTKETLEHISRSKGSYVTDKT